MDKQHVRYIEQLPLPKMTDYKYAYQVREDRPLVWLQQLCCWVMDKLEAYAQDRSIAYTYKDVDISNLVRGIYTQVGLLDRDHNLQGKRVLIGSEDFAQLCNAADARYHLTVYARDMKFGGLTVTVIPWMKGILVMPD